MQLPAIMFAQHVQDTELYFQIQKGGEGVRVSNGKRMVRARVNRFVADPGRNSGLCLPLVILPANLLRRRL